jgi:SAM-dependent methyltransferase
VDQPERVRSRVFGEVGEQYDRYRPTYPAELVEALTGAGDVRRVLDVGCGTGIAARLFLARGCEVLGVEPDARMAAVARRHGVTVDEATFETWEPRRAPYDLVASAQAWHWVDRAIGTERAASVLRPGGRLALFWNVSLQNEATEALFRDVYARYAPSVFEQSIALRSKIPPSVDETTDGHVAPIVANPRFGPIETRTYRRRVRHTTDEWVRQLATLSDHLLLDPDVRVALLGALARALDGAGGTLDVDYVTTLLTTARV